MKRISLVVGFILLHAVSQFAQTRVTVTAIANGLKETPAIRALRFATLEEEKVVRLGNTYQAGDELTGTGAVDIELKCPGGSLVKFSGPFRAVIVVQDSDQDCAINLLAGRVDVIADRPTSVQSGETTAGTKGTVYSMSLGRSHADVELACAVFDGAVDVRNGGLAGSTVREGSKQVWAPAGAKMLDVTTDDIKQTAALYARLDSSKGQIAGGRPTRASQAELESAYFRVFQRPADATARIALATQQVNLKVVSDAVYHLDRADRLAPANDRRLQARIALTRAVAYEESGDRQKATEQIQKAQRVDPSVFNKPDLDNYKIDSSRIQVISPTIRINPEKTIAVRPQVAVPPAPERESVRPRAANAAVRAGNVVVSVAEFAALMDMIKRGQVQEAAAGFSKRMERLGQSARDAYGLAVAYDRMQQRQEAVRYATLAINLHGKSPQLSAEELRTCRAIQSR